MDNEYELPTSSGLQLQVALSGVAILKQSLNENFTEECKCYFQANFEISSVRYNAIDEMKQLVNYSSTKSHNFSGLSFFFAMFPLCCWERIIHGGSIDLYSLFMEIP